MINYYKFIQHPTKPDHTNSSSEFPTEIKEIFFKCISESQAVDLYSENGSQGWRDKRELITQYLEKFMSQFLEPIELKDAIEDLIDSIKDKPFPESITPKLWLMTCKEVIKKEHYHICKENRMTEFAQYCKHECVQCQNLPTELDDKYSDDSSKIHSLIDLVLQNQHYLDLFYNFCSCHEYAKKFLPEERHGLYVDISQNHVSV